MPIMISVNKESLIKARQKGLTLAPRAVKVKPDSTTQPHKELSPWKAHRDLEKIATDLVSDQLLELFLTIRRQWLHQKKPFHKAQSNDLFKLNGRIFISPKTGKPLTTKQWDEVVKSLDKAVQKIFKNQPDILVKRAMLLGKVLDGMNYEARKESSLESIKEEKQLPKTDDWTNTYTFAQQHAAEQMVNLESQARKNISTTIINAIRNKSSTRQLEIALFDQFADLNKDWRRVAETEMASSLNAGLLLNESEDKEEGETVYMIGISAPGACESCLRLISNQVVVLVDSPVEGGTVKVDGKEYPAIWVGKNNVGRKEGNYWPCIPLHPHCRCSWTRYYKEFEELLGIKPGTQKAQAEEE